MDELALSRFCSYPVKSLNGFNNKELVEYAVADSDKDLLVSKYMLELPSTEQLQEFIRKELKK